MIAITTDFHMLYSVASHIHAQIQKLFLFVFLVDEGREDPNTTKSGPGNHRPACHLNGVSLAGR